MKKRILASLLAVTTIVSLTGCGNNGNSQSSSSNTSTSSTSSGATESGKTGSSTGAATTGTCADEGCVWDPYTPYAETVTFSKGLQKGGSDSNFPEGDSYVDNDFTRYVKSAVNVQPEIAWEVDANNYDQKVSLSISTGDIPDIMIVNRKIFKQLVENDLVWDMTEAYEKCVSPFVKEQYDTFGERLMREVRVDGKMMGIPGTQIEGQHNLFWVRKDWMEKLGLSEPKTLDDIEAIARAFVEKDPGGNGAGKTVGITTSEKVYGSYNGQHGLFSVFNYYNAYPNQWIEKDGKVVYGSTQPEMKDALTKLSTWYKDGILDKEFAVRKGADREALISSGQLGIMFGPWWGWGGVPDSVKNNPEADWGIYAAPKDADGKIHLYAQDPLNSILVVSKKFKHPEAIVKALNATNDVLRGNGDGEQAYEDALVNSPNMGWWTVPVALQIGYEDSLKRGYEDITNALAANDPSVMKQKGFDNVYNAIKREQENPRADVFNWQEALIRTDGTAAAIDPDAVVQDIAFYGKTDTMNTKWANLEKLETETMIKIIMGEKPLEEFDAFVETWNKMGGTEILAEVQAEVDAMK